MFKTDILDDLNDKELASVIQYAQELLTTRDSERKSQAMDEARAILAAAGISMKELNGKAKVKPKGRVYRTRQQFQHPTNKELVWSGKGKKPSWLRALESQGKLAMEVTSA